MPSYWSTSARARSCAVCSQCSCSSVSRCSQIRPRDTAPGGPSLAVGAATHPIQTVRADVSLPQRSSAMILDWAGNAHRRHCLSSLQSASSTDLVVPATRRSTISDRAFAIAGPEHVTVFLLLSAPLPHTTSSKKTLNLTFLDYPSHCDNCVLWLCTALL